MKSIFRPLKYKFFGSLYRIRRTRQLSAFIMDFMNASSWYLDDERMLHVENSLKPMNEGCDYSQHVTHLICAATQPYRKELMSLFEEERDGIYTTEFQVESPDNATHWLEMRMKVSHRNGSVRRSGVFTNIDKRKQVEAAMIDAHYRTTNTLQYDNFVEVMSEEIKKPAERIEEMCRQIAEHGAEMPKEELERLKLQVSESGTYLKRIIQDTLLLTNLRSGNISLKEEGTTIADLIERFSNAYKDRIQQAGLTFMFFPTKKNFSFSVDIKMLKTFTEYVVDNAIKFNQPGGTISCGNGIKDGIPFIYISDSGIGMTPEQKEHVYDTFYKADPESKGLGLGMTIVHEYITTMGYRMEISTELGMGTSVLLYFDKHGIGTK